MNDEASIASLYDGFNARDIDAVLSQLTPDVAWANGMDGAHVHGRDAVRSYWTAQWTTIDPHVEPMKISRSADGSFVVECTKSFTISPERGYSTKWCDTFLPFETVSFAVSISEPGRSSLPSFITEADGSRRIAESFLRAHGAEAIAHPGGTLYTHLMRTADRLQAWEARDELVLAGLCHATYGTDGFDVHLVPHTQRGTLADAVGNDVEGVVYAYASCDRERTYAEFARTHVLFDRFGSTQRTLNERELRDFVEITVANELDVLAHSSKPRARFGPDIASLFADLAHLASPSARVAFRSELAEFLT